MYNRFSFVQNIFSFIYSTKSHYPRSFQSKVLRFQDKIVRFYPQCGGASSTPCEASDSAKGLVKESRHRSECFLRCAPAGIGRTACRTTGEREPLQARTVQRSALALAEERESRSGERQFCRLCVRNARMSRALPPSSRAYA